MIIRISKLIINKVSDPDSSMLSKNSKPCMAESSLISNLDNWMGNISQDDSKQFEENYKDLKSSNCKPKTIKKRQIQKMKYLTNSPNNISRVPNPPGYTKGLEIIIPEDSFNKDCVNEDYIDGTDENIKTTSEKEMDNYIKDYKDRNMLFRGLSTTHDRPFTFKYNTCPDEEFRNENKHQTFNTALKKSNYDFPTIIDTNFSSAGNPDSNILIQNYASNGSTNISSLSNTQFTYNSPKKHQKFNSDHNIEGNNTISGTRMYYKGIQMITPKHLAFNSEDTKNESEFDMDRSKKSIINSPRIEL